MTSPTGNERNDGSQFTRRLVLLVVILPVVLVILVRLLLPPVVGSRPAPIKSAIAQIGAFGTALDMFKADNGSYPTSKDGLNVLVAKPTNASTDWHQYLDHVPLDPWGHPYLYVSPGQHNPNSYDLSSAGPDGIPGTQDDINNWELFK